LSTRPRSAGETASGTFPASLALSAAVDMSVLSAPMSSLLQTPIPVSGDQSLRVTSIYEYADDELHADHTPDDSDFEHSAATALLGLFASAPRASAPIIPQLEKRKHDPQPSGGSAQLAPSSAQPGGWEGDAGSSGSSSPKVARRAGAKDGAPPPGSCRFQCRYPGCSKLYASTDAVRKHCRKRHYDWLRRLDQLAAHERQMPKPALYCRWGSGGELA